MKKKGVKSGAEPKKEESAAAAVRLPGFVNDEDVGLGDAIKRVTNAFGIKPCGGCERRAATFNRWFTFSGRRPK